MPWRLKLKVFGIVMVFTAVALPVAVAVSSVEDTRKVPRYTVSDCEAALKTHTGPQRPKECANLSESTYKMLKK